MMLSRDVLVSSPGPTLCKENGLVTIERFLGNAHHQQAMCAHIYIHAYAISSAARAYELPSNASSVTW